MLRRVARVYAATSSQVWATVRGADARASALSILRRRGSSRGTAPGWRGPVGWVACSDPSAATSAGFPRPAPWRRGRAGVAVPVRPRYH